jgi:tetratricopeptide (TPR) repeat protein
LAAFGVVGMVGLGLWLIWRPTATDPRSRGHWEAVFQGRRLLDEGRPDLALKAVSHIRDEAEGAGEAMAVAGVALARMEDVRNARLALERALKLQPRQPLATRVLAAVYLGLGESDRGLDCLKKAAELSPRDPRPWFAMGRVYLDLGESVDAERVYREALKRDPNNAEARVGRVESLLALGRTEEAGTLADDSLSRFPKDARLLGLAARQARDSGKAEEAMALADRALAIDPENAEALLCRARLHHVAGRSELARVDLEKLVSQRPNHLAALNLLGQVESRLGLTDKAAETSIRRKRAGDRLVLMDALTKEMSTRPNDPQPRYQMGAVALEGNQRELAASCFQAALMLDPNHQPSRSALSALKSARRGAPRLELDGER